MLLPECVIIASEHTIWNKVGIETLYAIARAHIDIYMQ